MTRSETMALYQQYVIGNYTRLPVVFVRGEGSYLWDADGRRYLDLFPGWGVDGLGHCHPRVVAAIREQAGKLLHVANNYYMEPQARFAKMISEHSFGGKCFFCNSGAEANEGAMKLARLATHAAAGPFDETQGRPEHGRTGGASRWKFITFENSFHGRTLAAISATAQPKYHKGFEPIVPGFLYAPFNDLKAVASLVDKETCAILVEPIQGEGGVNLARPEFLQGLRKICDREGMILIFDEVQTGCGRTGKWFGYQHCGVIPDIMTLSKALGGGTAVGALVAQPKTADHLTPGTHASTFGGNPLVCAAGIAAFEAIEEEDLLKNTVAVGRHTLGRLEAMKARFPFVREVRGKGLMIGMELDRPGKDVVARCLAQGLLINCTHDAVIRMLPAMTISREIMDEGLDILEESLAAEK